MVRKHDKAVRDPGAVAGYYAVHPSVVEGGVHRLLRGEAPQDGVVVPGGEGGHVAVHVGQPVVSPWHHAETKLIGDVDIDPFEG